MSDLQLIPAVSLAEQTTIRIGGDAAWYTRVYDVDQLAEAVSWAEAHSVCFLFVGEGSNILFSDAGFPGLVIRNRFLGFQVEGSEVEVAGGENLGETIRRVNRLGLAGLESMYGIPGTVAGAIVGNAGAYGQEIRDSIVHVRVWSPREGIEILSPEALRFSYRHSLLKERRELFVLGTRLRLTRVASNLQKKSEEILSRRVVKYPPDLRCPGSFFKNILADRLPPETLRNIPPDYIQFGKIPAGKLLEAVGAKGAILGDASIADYHGNLLINRGLASSHEILALASEFAGRVWDTFHVRLEPEILIVGNDTPPNLRESKG